MVEEDTYTFIGVSRDGAALFMDIACLQGDAAARRHGENLLILHTSGNQVEVWRGASLIGEIPRQPPAEKAAALGLVEDMRAGAWGSTNLSLQAIPAAGPSTTPAAIAAK